MSVFGRWDYLCDLGLPDACSYIADYRLFLDDLASGRYVENSVDTVMLDVDGKRLMCEALYLLGVMLIFMDLRIPGPIREVLIIAHFRHKVSVRV